MIDIAMERIRRQGRAAERMRFLHRVAERMVERDRYRQALEEIVELGDSWHVEVELAKAALDG